MTDLFDSPLFRANIEERDFLRDRMLNQWETVKGTGDIDKLIEVLHTIYAAVAKEEILYARLKLATDPQAKELLADVQQRVLEVSDVDPESFYRNIKDSVRSRLESIGEDLDMSEDLLS